MIEKRVVKVGLCQLDHAMTLEQARRWGDRHLPKDLARAGFSTVVFVSDPDINGSLFYRVSFGRK